MKTKVLIISALMAFIGCFTASAQQAATQTSQGGLTFNERIHDFGQINEADGRVKTIFEFVNDTNVPITMTNVQASCGCTVPEWSREPIAPKKKGYISVTFNPAGRPGNFRKSITVRYTEAGSTQSKATTLNIRGEVIPAVKNVAK